MVMSRTAGATLICSVHMYRILFILLAAKGLCKNAFKLAKLLARFVIVVENSFT